MRHTDLKSLEVSQSEVKAALARERRRGVRRASRGPCQDFGRQVHQAERTRAAKATRGSVERWLKQVRQAGLQSLLRDRRRRYRKREMTHAQAEEARREIAAALKRPLKPQVRSRLVVIDRALSGEPINDAAAGARVRPNTLKAWLRVVTYDGIARTLARWEGDAVRVRPRLVDADPVSLRELAAKERNPRIRKRMLALAYVADGKSPHDAGMRSGLAHNAVPKWIARFRKEGVAGLRDRTIAGRPHKLNRAQLEEVAQAFLSRPELGSGELGDLIWARYRVRYSPERLRHLLKTKLGTEWKPARSRPERQTRAIAEDGIRHRRERVHQEAGIGPHPASPPHARWKKARHCSRAEASWIEVTQELLSYRCNPPCVHIS